MSASNEEVEINIAGSSNNLNFLNNNNNSSIIGSLNEENNNNENKIKTDIGIENVESPKTITGFDGTVFDTGAQDNRNTIYLSGLNDYTGPYAAVSGALETSMRLFWKYVNSECGGIGNKYNVILKPFKDTSYDPDKHKTGLLEILDENNVLALSITLGTPQTLGVIDLLKENNLIASPMSWWSGWSNPEVTGNCVLPFSGSNYIDGINMLDYAKENNFNVKKIAVIGFAGDYGTDFYYGVEKFIEKNKDSTIVYRKIVNTLELFGLVTQIIEELKTLDYDVLMLAIAPNLTPLILGELAKNNKTPQLTLLAGPSWNEAFMEEGSSNKELFLNSNIIISSIAGKPLNTNISINNVIRKMSKEININVLSAFITAGWLSQYTIYNTLCKAYELGDLTRKGVREAVSQTKQTFDDLAQPRLSYYGMQTVSYLLKPKDNSAGILFIGEYQGETAVNLNPNVYPEYNVENLV